MAYLGGGRIGPAVPDDLSLPEARETTRSGVVDSIVDIGNKGLDVADRFVGIFGDFIFDGEDQPRQPGDDPGGPSKDRTSNGRTDGGGLAAALMSNEAIGIGLILIGIILLILWDR